MTYGARIWVWGGEKDGENADPSAKPKGDGKNGREKKKEKT